jgi:hypothetical protein
VCSAGRELTAVRPRGRTRATPSRAVARATAAAAVKAIENPVRESVCAAAPLADVPRELKVAVPTAAPIWLIEPARPAARPVCVSGTAPVMTIVVGVKLSATPTATRARPGRTATRYDEELGA